MKGDSKITRDELVLKIETETLKIRKIFESCVTLEHVDVTNKLACFLVDKWNWYGSNFDLGYTCNKIWPWINSAASDMTKFYNEARKRVIEQMNKVEQTNKKVIIGHWD